VVVLEGDDMSVIVQDFVRVHKLKLQAIPKLIAQVKKKVAAASGGSSNKTGSTSGVGSMHTSLPAALILPVVVNASRQTLMVRGAGNDENLRVQVQRYA